LSISHDGSVQSPLLVLVGSGSRVYHEYLLSLMAECARVWLFLDAEPTWEKLYITGHTVVDTHDPAAVADAATLLAGWLSVDGVVCLDDTRSTQSAAAAASLGLPTTGPDAVREQIVDEYDLTVDAACVDGDVFPLFVSRRINTVLPEMAGPGHIVDAADPALADEETTAAVAAAHRATGVRHGVSHTRVRRTSRGPQVVGVHWGLSPDLVPYAASLAAGVNPGRVVAQVACGLRPDPISAPVQRVAAVRFFTRPPDAAIGAVQADESHLPLTVDVVEALTTPDAQPTEGSLRYAYSVVVDDTVEGCARALTAAERAFVPRPRGEFRNDPPADERRPSAVIPHATVLPDPSAGTVR
jgi:hypothetical protein